MVTTSFICIDYMIKYFSHFSGAGGYKILKLMNEVHLVVTTSLFLWFVGCMMAVMWFIVRKLEAGTNFRGLKLPAHNQAPTHSLIWGLQQEEDRTLTSTSQELLSWHCRRRSSTGYRKWSRSTFTLTHAQFKHLLGSSLSLFFSNKRYCEFVRVPHQHSRASVVSTARVFKHSWKQSWSLHLLASQTDLFLMEYFMQISDFVF